MTKRASKRRSLNVVNQSVRSHFDPISHSLNHESPIRLGKKPKVSKSRPSGKKCSQKSSFVQKSKVPMSKTFKKYASK